ncbi:MAG TPA: extracellular solute-binding protein [Candidatus Acidoferrales bacterium]|nr:extracellular solute-binding protein [Candidatus Acidoferrales bacterium]
MKFGLFVGIALAMLFPAGLPALHAASTVDLNTAKAEAEAKGYIFELRHDDIVAKAKKERGKMRAHISQDPPTFNAIAEAFKAEYPFVDPHVEELTGTDATQRFFLQVKAGRAQGWDAGHLSDEVYQAYQPYLKKFDIFGMARHGVLRIPTEIIDPVKRNIAAVNSGTQVIAYNKKLLAAERLPSTWEDFLKPEFKGRKFAADIRPTEIAALVPAWGLEKTLAFARQIAAQEPIWVRGATRTLTAMAAGEYALFLGPNFNTVMRAIKKDLSGSLDLKVVEPVPVRLTEALAVLASSERPYTALLWIEFQASPKGQKLVDEFHPYGASAFIAGSAQERLLRGKRLSVVQWDHFSKLGEYQAKVVEAYGFPKEERKK